MSEHVRIIGAGASRY